MFFRTLACPSIRALLLHGYAQFSLQVHRMLADIVYCFSILYLVFCALHILYSILHVVDDVLDVVCVAFRLVYVLYAYELIC